MCGRVNDSNGENISNDKTYFSLLLILLSLLLFDLCFGRTWTIFFFFFSYFFSGGQRIPLILLSDTCPFFPLRWASLYPRILLRTLVHFYLSSHSFFFFFEVPGTCPFLFPRIFLHNPCLFCIESFQRERITILRTVSDNIFSNFNE